MNDKIKQIRQALTPYRDILRFVIVLLATHLFWKYSIHYPKDDLSSFDLTWFGIDISAPFVWMTAQVTNLSHWLLTLTGNDITLFPGNLMRWANGSPLRVVWGCCGLKQMFIFTCIILFARGKWPHKTWFIPMGLIVCFIYNVLRIIFLTLVVENHIDWFPLFHDYITKYLFYAVIFFLWVWWNERFNKANTKKQ